MRKVPHKGEVLLDVPGEGEVALRYDWGAIAHLHGMLGKSWESEVRRIVTELDPKSLADILAVGSWRDAEWWMEKSPPFVPAAKAVQEALHLAFFGPEAVPENPQTARWWTILSRKAGLSGSNSAGAKIHSGH